MYKFLMLSIAGAVIVGGAAVYLLISDRPETAELANHDVPAKSADPITNESVAGRGTLDNIMALAQNLECKINYQTEVAVRGTYFTSQGKMRGDFITPSAQGDLLSSFIMHDNTMYSWSEIDGKKYGLQFDLSAVEAAKADGDIPETREPVPLNAAVDYDCKPWVSFDGSIFKPPSDIIFKDFSNVLNAGMEFGTIYEETGDTESQCELCTQVPAGTGRNECLAAFSCQ